VENERSQEVVIENAKGGAVRKPAAAKAPKRLQEEEKGVVESQEGSNDGGSEDSASFSLNELKEIHT